MKHKIKELWYFIQWLFKDTNWITVLSIIVLVIGWSLAFLPNEYALPLAIFVVIYGIGMFLYFIVYKTLEYQYRRYKKEQQELFDKIKNSE
jgi:membrane protein YdbS with pleckstrin-like domain